MGDENVTCGVLEHVSDKIDIPETAVGRFERGGWVVNLEWSFEAEVRFYDAESSVNSIYCEIDDRLVIAGNGDVRFNGVFRGEFDASRLQRNHNL
jgi:hypothetical protein